MVTPLISSPAPWRLGSVAGSRRPATSGLDAGSTGATLAAEFGHQHRILVTAFMAEPGQPHGQGSVADLAFGGGGRRNRRQRGV